MCSTIDDRHRKEYDVLVVAVVLVLVDAVVERILLCFARDALQIYARSTRYNGQ
jgi:hypothetical protein